MWLVNRAAEPQNPGTRNPRTLSLPAAFCHARDVAFERHARTFSLYCALEKATDEVTGGFKQRGAAMQEARFVIDEALAKGNKYEHRLKDYNNDRTTTFADVQRFFRLLEVRILSRSD